MRKRTVSGGVVLLLVAGIAAWFVPLTPARSDIEQRAREAARAGWVGAAVQTPIARRPSPMATAARTEFGPLPPVDSPVRDIYPGLVRRAHAGDFRASCRLSHELFRCAFLSSYIGHSAGLLERLAKKDDERSREVERKTKAKMAREEGVCAGFSSSEALPAWQYLFEAAMAGHIPSMARFAIVPPLHPLDIGSAPLAWQVYRHYAPGFLREAADAGESSAVFTMVDTSMGEPTFASHFIRIELVPVDFAVAAKYAHASRTFYGMGPKSLYNGIFKRLSERLSPEEMDLAERQGRELAATWDPKLRERADMRSAQILPVTPLDCIER